MYLKNEMYEAIEKILQQEKKKSGRGNNGNMRIFIEGIIYVMHSGIGWRQLPKEYGKWYSVWQRFDRWSKNGLWAKIFTIIQPAFENGTIAIDSTSIKVHQEGLRYKKKTQKLNKWLEKVAVETQQKFTPQ